MSPADRHGCKILKVFLLLFLQKKNNRYAFLN